MKYLDQTETPEDLGNPEAPEDLGDPEEPGTPTPSEDLGDPEPPETSEGLGDPEDPKKSKKLRKRKKPKPEENSKPSALKALARLLIKLSVVALVIWLALIYVFGVFRLSGNNMYPALKDGDLCITYRLDPYYSSDVVVYRVGEEIRFGRIVARAGDTVNGDSTGLLVNGGHPSEEIFFPTQMLGTNLTLPVTLKKGEVMILNDFREDFSDSRTYGVINVEDLEGKVIFIFRRRGI